MKKRKHTVLLVDDDRLLLDIYAKKAEQSDTLSLRIAPSPGEALEMLRRGFSPDIIVTDIEMQGMRGADFVKEVRKGDLAQNARFIVLSSHDRSAYGEEFSADRPLFLNKAELLPSEALARIGSFAASDAEKPSEEETGKRNRTAHS